MTNTNFIPLAIGIGTKWVDGQPVEFVLTRGEYEFKAEDIGAEGKTYEVRHVFMVVTPSATRYAQSVADAERILDDNQGFITAINPLNTDADRMRADLDTVRLNQLEGYYDNLDGQRRDALYSAVRSIGLGVEAHVRFSEYLSARQYGADHKGALKTQNKKTRAVRKAQGYNSTDDVNF